MILVLLAGLCAGALTTVAGMGGGVLLTLILLTVLPHQDALTITGPALLVGNIHRIVLYRQSISRRHALEYVAGGLPGAFVGGLLALRAPEALVQSLAAFMALLAAGRVAFGWTWRPPPGALLPGGAIVGLATATSGAGGLLAGPMLLASGLTGRVYVATAAVGAASVHIGRFAAYGLGGWVRGELVFQAMVLAVALLIGNVIGDRLFSRLPAAWVPKLEVGVSLLCVTLAILPPLWALVAR